MGAVVESNAQLLLRAWREGDVDARDRLIELVHGELLDISAALLRGEGNCSLSSDDLVNEAVIRLIQLHQIDWRDKCHFLALSARVMRRVLIDHARRKASDKRDHQRVTLVTHIEGKANRIDLLNLENALTRLGAIDPEKAAIVELRFFGGMSIAEAATATGASETTVKRHWRAARAWLIEAMGGLE